MQLHGQINSGWDRGTRDHLEAEVVYGDAKAEDLLRGVVHLRGQVRGELESTNMCVHAIQDRGNRGKRRERAAS